MSWILACARMTTATYPFLFPRRIPDKAIRRLFRHRWTIRPFDKLKAPQTQGASSTGWTLRLSEGRGCEGRGNIGVRFDRLNELGDERSLSLRPLSLLVASRSGFHAAAGSFRRGRPPCLPCASGQPQGVAPTRGDPHSLGVSNRALHSNKKGISIQEDPAPGATSRHAQGPHAHRRRSMDCSPSCMPMFWPR